MYRLALAMLLILVVTLIFGRTDKFPAENFEPGPNGEPPKALPKVYSKQFFADQRNYVTALGMVHAFLIDNQFSTAYSRCFNDVLDIRVTANIEEHKRAFPCVVLQAQQGAPTKVYLSVTVDDVWFNQLDHNDRLGYTVSIYGREDSATKFLAFGEPGLKGLFSRKPTGQAALPHNISLQGTPRLPAVRP